MTSEPTAQQLPMPAEYGTPSTLLAWPPVERRLAAAKRYWLSTTRPDGRPHAVPVDGLWLDRTMYFGGSPKTVTQRNLAHNRAVVLHLEDADAAVIVEGECEIVVPDETLVQRLVATSTDKYGYAPPADAYRAGVWTLTPSRVLAWTQLPVDATRFVFTRSATTVLPGPGLDRGHDDVPDRAGPSDARSGDEHDDETANPVVPPVLP